MNRIPPHLPEISSRYRGLEPVGSGAMGSVYRAVDTLLNVPVAIKVLPAGHVSSDEVEYFKLEFRTVADLEHPNLVRVFDFGETPAGDLYYSMELLPDGSLASLPLPLNQETLLSATVQLCRALQYIHSRGIIHRDIKPANVLLEGRPRGNHICVKLTDFGLASLPKGTAPSSPSGGTPAYAAPEVLAGGTVDFRADLFSLGVLVYELCTGRLPFSWQDGGIAQIAAPTSLNAKLQREIDTLVLKLLEVDPPNRYRDANSVIDGINHLFCKKLAAETETTGISYILSPALAGREKELRAIKTELSALAGVHMPAEGEARAARSSGDAQAAGAKIPGAGAGVILISGPTGIGKTRLVQEAKLFCQLNRIRFCLGQGMSGSSVPGGPLVEAMRSLLSAMPADKLPEPGPILGPFIEQTRGRKQIEAEDQSSFGESAYQFLRSAAEISPTVLCIEDIQWADPLTLTAISHLARGFFLTALGEPSFAAPCRILITVDDSGSLSKGQKALLVDLSDAPFVMHIRPEALSAEQVALVAASMFGPGVLPEGGAERLHAATSGLPLFLQQLMAQLLHQGALRQELGRWRLALADIDSLPAPKGTKERAATVLAGLAPEERAITEAMSVLISPASTEEISSLAGLPYPRTRKVLNELLRRALISERRRQFSLPAGPLSNSIYGLLHWSKRRGLHIEAARLIEKKPMERRARIHALAHHYLLAKDKERALKWGLTAARDSARAQVYSEAAAYCMQLLKLGLDPALKPEILLEYGQSLAATGKPEQAIRTYKEAAGLISREKTPLKPRLQRLIGEAFVDLGDLPQARRWLRRAMESSSISPGDAIQATTTLAFVEHNAGRPAEADRCLKRARQRVMAVGAADELRSRFHRVTGSIMADRGNFNAAIPDLKEALKHARESGNLTAQARSYSILGLTYQRLFMHGRSLRALTEALEIGKRMSSPVTVAIQLMNIGAIHYDRGDYAAVTRDLLEASALFGRSGSLRLYSQSLANLGLIQAEIGRYEAAFEYVGNALSMQTKRGYHRLALTSRSIMVTALIHTGRIDEALRLAEINLDQAKKAGISRELYMAYKDTAEAYLLRGRVRKAEALLTASLDGFKETGEKDEICDCLAKLASLKEGEGETEKAYLLSMEAVKMAIAMRSMPSQLKAAVSTTPRYAREIGLIRRLAERIESPELRWRACVACAEHFIRRGDMNRGLQEYKKCLGVFRSVTADIADPKLRDSYLKHPHRLKVFSRIRALSSKQKSR